MIGFNIEAIRGAYDNSPFAFAVIRIVTDENGTAKAYECEYANEALAQLEQHSIEELTGEQVHTLFKDSDEKWLKLYSTAALEGKAKVYTEYRSEIKKYIRLQCYQLSYGYCGCLLLDVTEEQETEQALRASEEKFRIATENSDISFWTYDLPRRVIIQTNSSVLHHGFKEVVENVPESLIESGHIRKDSAESFLEMYRKLQNGEKTACGDFWTYNDQKETWWCEHIDYTNMFDEDGNPTHAYAVGRDVTTIKLAEKKYCVR